MQTHRRRIQSACVFSKNDKRENDVLNTILLRNATSCASCAQIVFVAVVVAPGSIAPCTYTNYRVRVLKNLSYFSLFSEVSSELSVMVYRERFFCALMCELVWLKCLRIFERTAEISCIERIKDGAQRDNFNSSWTFIRRTTGRAAVWRLTTLTQRAFQNIVLGPCRCSMQASVFLWFMCFDIENYYRLHFRECRCHVTHRELFVAFIVTPNEALGRSGWLAPRPCDFVRSANFIWCQSPKYSENPAKFSF